MFNAPIEESCGRISQILFGEKDIFGDGEEGDIVPVA
jgi:hypothetical protein